MAHGDEDEGSEDVATVIGAPVPRPAPARVSALAYLVASDAAGVDHGRCHFLRTSRVVVGRSPTADIVISHKLASRHHARFERDADGAWVVTDLNSSNGTFVNGEQVMNHRLRSGEVVQIGGVDFKFMAASEPRAVLGDVYNETILAPLVKSMSQGGGAIENLGTDLQDTAIRLMSAVMGSEQQEEFERTLQVACAIQDSLIPSSDGEIIFHTGGVQLAGFHRSATHCGGDWWTSCDLGDGRVLVVIGDVTGHGLPAAMVTATAKGCCEALKATTAGADIGPAKVLGILNDSMWQIRGTMTCFASVIESRASRIVFANGGHVFPYVLSAGASEPTITPLAQPGPLLGTTPSASFVEQQHPLEPGEMLLWYTDGLVECTNRAGQLYGLRRLRHALARASLQGGPKRPLDVVTTDAFAFIGDTPLADDLTVVVGLLER